MKECYLGNLFHLSGTKEEQKVTWKDHEVIPSEKFSEAMQIISLLPIQGIFFEQIQL